MGGVDHAPAACGQPDPRDARVVGYAVANLTAGIQYMIEHYGLSTLKAGGRTNSAGNYVGY